MAGGARLGGQVAAVSRALSMAVPVVLVVTAAVVTAAAVIVKMGSMEIAGLLDHSVRDRHGHCASC